MLDEQKMKTRGGEAITSGDRVGKVFVALSDGMRLCLICEGVFTRQAAAEHARTVCYPLERDSGMGK
jgi:hypothetical protein